MINLWNIKGCGRDGAYPDTLEDPALHVAVYDSAELVRRVASRSLCCPADAEERVVFRCDTPAAGHSPRAAFGESGVRGPVWLMVSCLALQLVEEMDLVCLRF